MSSYQLSPAPVLRVWDNAGNLAVGGSVYTYQAGTSTPIATYTDYTGSVQNTNPIVLNSRGETDIWLDPSKSYKFVAYDASGNLLWSQDQITAPVPTSSMPGATGSGRSIRASTTSAGTSVTYYGDEFIVETANNVQYRVPLTYNSLNLQINTVGAGGMDNGTAPANGYVSIYVIYNPSTGATALLAQSGGSSQGSNGNLTYYGNYLPAGYTATALIGVWPTNGSSQLVQGAQFDRTMYPAKMSVLASSSLSVSTTSLSIASAVPPNAISVFGTVFFSSVTGTGQLNVGLFSNSAGNIGTQVVEAYSVATGIQDNYANIPLITPQVIYYSITNTGVSAATTNIYITGYTF